MLGLKIKTELPPERCEICHQTDCFDALTNSCTRCAGIVNANDEPPLNPATQAHNAPGLRQEVQLGRDDRTVSMVKSSLAALGEPDPADQIHQKIENKVFTYTLVATMLGGAVWLAMNLPVNNPVELIIALFVGLIFGAIFGSILGAVMTALYKELVYWLRALSRKIQLRNNRPAKEPRHHRRLRELNSKDR